MSASPSSDSGSEARGRDESPPGSRGVSRTELSAGGVVVRRFDDRTRVLLILDPYGKWGLPKGHLEGEEGRAEAAIREVREETALENVEIGPEVETVSWSFRSGRVRVDKVCTFYLMWSSTGRARPYEAEGIRDCAWSTFDEAAARTDYDNVRGVLRKAERMLATEGPTEW